MIFRPATLWYWVRRAALACTECSARQPNGSFGSSSWLTNFMASASNGWTSGDFFVHLLDEFGGSRGGPWGVVRSSCR